MKSNRQLPMVGPATAKFFFPQQNPDSVLKNLRGEDRLFTQAELAAARCDFSSARDLYERLSASPTYFASATRFGVIAAIGLGDVALFDAVIRRLIVMRRTSDDATMSVLADLAEGWIHQWMWIPTGYAGWIERFDFENVPAQCRDSAAYLSTKVCLTRGQFAAAYASAALMMNYFVPSREIAARDVYLMMTRAVACRETGRDSEMKKWLRDVVQKLAPHDMLLPLLPFMHGSAKSPVCELIGEIRPDLVSRYRKLVASYFKNMVLVRNHYLGEHVTDRLSFREMYLAMLLKRGMTYGELATRFEVSVGRLKNVISKIYEKLGIHSRGELKGLVW